MKNKSFLSSAGIEIQAISEDLEVDSALDSLLAAIDTHKGCIFSSGFDFPGRHSRWDIGFVNPALEFVAQARHFELNALNPQGQALLELIAPSLAEHQHVESLEKKELALRGIMKPPPKHFPEEERSRQASVFSVLRALSELFCSKENEASYLGLYGAFGYDLVTQFEELELRHPRSSAQADCHLYLPLELVVVDRKKEVATKWSYSIQTPQGSTSSMPDGGQAFPRPEGSGEATVSSDHKPGEFAKKVDQVIKGTERGDYFEVVLSQCFSTRFDDLPTNLFRRLANINPSPYMFLFNFGKEQLVGSSPEIYVRVNGKRYETCPIAGTVPRGKSALEDADQAYRLITSFKDESELTMCTDVDRNDMARVCEPGTVRIIGRRQLEFYSHLIHTVDHLEGTLKDDFDALDAFQTHMWACTVTGAPKPAALQEIENLENSPRAWYSGAIGFLSFSGNINTGITLRTAHLKEGQAVMRAGATLLFGSDPEKEELETRTKAGAFLAAIAAPEKQQGDSSMPSETHTLLIRGEKRRILLVDYKDSFVHNLAAYLRLLGAEVITLRCGFPIEMLDEIKPDLVFLSPGPGTPEEFGIPPFVETLVKKNLPIFGVCLGHQGIGQHFGATLGTLPIPEHGKPSIVHHSNSPLFADIEGTFEAGRYHSLYLLHDSIPDCLEVTAYALRKDSEKGDEKIPMAVRHKKLPIAGVQFHPESLMTLKNNTGHLILRNAIESLS